MNTRKSAAAGPISAAIAKSEQASEPRKLDLESALCDASNFGRLLYGALCHMGFDSNEPPQLSADESDLVYWSLCELNGHIEQAKAAFYGKDRSS